MPIPERLQLDIVQVATSPFGFAAGFSAKSFRFGGPRPWLSSDFRWGKSVSESGNKNHNSARKWSQWGKHLGREIGWADLPWAVLIQDAAEVCTGEHVVYDCFGNVSALQENMFLLDFLLHEMEGTPLHVHMCDPYLSRNSPSWNPLKRTSNRDCVLVRSLAPPTHPDSQRKDWTFYSPNRAPRILNLWVPYWQSECSRHLSGRL